MILPEGVLVDATGDVYVNDRGTMPDDPGHPSRVQKFDGPSFAP